MFREPKGYGFLALSLLAAVLLFLEGPTTRRTVAAGLSLVGIIGLMMVTVAVANITVNKAEAKADAAALSGRIDDLTKRIEKLEGAKAP